MAFGFLVEKFELFLEIAAHPLAGVSMPGRSFGNVAGLAFIMVGTAMVVIAGVPRPFRRGPRRTRHLRSP